MPLNNDHIENWFDKLKDNFENFEVEVPESEISSSWKAVQNQLPVNIQPQIGQIGKGISYKAIGLAGAGIATLVTAVIIAINLYNPNTKNTIPVQSDNHITISDSQPDNLTESGKKSLDDDYPKTNESSKLENQKLSQANITSQANNFTDTEKPLPNLLKGNENLRDPDKSATPGFPNIVYGKLNKQQAFTLSIADTLICGKDSVRLYFNRGTASGQLLLNSHYVLNKEIEGYYSFFPIKSGHITLSFVYRENGKDAVFKQQISFIAKPEALFDFMSLGTSEVQFYNKSKGSNYYHWYFGDNDESESLNPRHIYYKEGSFRVKLVSYSTATCKDSLVKTVSINSKSALRIPNIFTPNGDGINDYFEILGENVIHYELTIVDRYGNIVFQSNSLENSWTGKDQTSGMDCLNGTYYYVVKFRLAGQSEAEKRTGTIRLER